MNRFIITDIKKKNCLMDGARYIASAKLYCLDTLVCNLFEEPLEGVFYPSKIVSEIMYKEFTDSSRFDEMTCFDREVSKLLRS